MVQGDAVPGLVSIPAGGVVNVQPPAGEAHKHFGIPTHDYYQGASYVGVWSIYKYDGSTEVRHGTDHGLGSDGSPEAIGAIANRDVQGSQPMASMISTNNEYLRVHNNDGGSSQVLPYEGIQIK